MKIAFCGKGGSGKTTLASAMVRSLSEDGRSVLAVDADPNSNLAAALGFPDAAKIRPIVEMKDLIYKRMDIKDDPKGSFYKLNPRVDDIPEKFVKRQGQISLIVMGTVDAGGSGCVCPESTFLRELLKHLVMEKGEDIVMDMEAGIEHLGRSTAVSMDCILAVSEPTVTGVDTARRVKQLADDLKMRTFFVGNKIAGKEDEDFVSRSLGKAATIGLVRTYDGMRNIDRGGSIMDIASRDSLLTDIRELKEKLYKLTENTAKTGSR